MKKLVAILCAVAMLMAFSANPVLAGTTTTSAPDRGLLETLTSWVDGLIGWIAGEPIGADIAFRPPPLSDED